MRIVALSDTHDHPLHTTWEVPDGDVFIHSGDFCIGANVPLEKLTALNDQFAALPHKHKLLVGGNHDWPLMLEPEKARELLTALNLPRGQRCHHKWCQVLRFSLAARPQDVGVQSAAFQPRAEAEVGSHSG